MVKKRKPNPVLEKKYEEGKWVGIQLSTDYYLARFEELKKVPGIGPKTQELDWFKDNINWSHDARGRTITICDGCKGRK